MTTFLKKNIIIIILMILLLASFFYNLKLRNDIYNITNVDIVGTFSTENEHDAEYFVFTKDGTFYNYKQFKLLQKGTYEIDEHILTLNCNDIQKHVVFGNKNIYYFNNAENNIFKYSKINETPLFINLEGVTIN